MKKIQIHEYNPLWPKIFELEKEKLVKIFDKKFVQIHHFGSTSIPNLAAKNVIDIWIEVDAMENLEEIFKQLYEDGFEKEKQFFPLCYFTQKNCQDYEMHLHVTFAGNDRVVASLHFRDYLKSNPKIQTEYENLKKKLAENPQAGFKIGPFPIYNRMKNDFISKVLKKSGFKGLIVNFCHQEIEWKFFHKITNSAIFADLNVQYDPNHPNFSNENFHNFVLYLGSTIIGIAQIEKFSKSEAVIRLLAIKEEFRYKGYGKFLIKFLENWVKFVGFKEIKLHSAYKSVEFYKKCGYLEIDFSQDKSIDPKAIDFGKIL